MRTVKNLDIAINGEIKKYKVIINGKTLKRSDSTGAYCFSGTTVIVTLRELLKILKRDRRVLRANTSSDKLLKMLYNDNTVIKVKKVTTENKKYDYNKMVADKQKRKEKYLNKKLNRIAELEKEIAEIKIHLANQ